MGGERERERKCKQEKVLDLGHSGYGLVTFIHKVWSGPHIEGLHLFNILQRKQF